MNVFITFLNIKKIFSNVFYMCGWDGCTRQPICDSLAGSKLLVFNKAGGNPKTQTNLVSRFVSTVAEHFQVEIIN